MSDQPNILIELQYLPPVQYFTILAASPNVQLESQEHYVKGTYRNRCHIASVNGVQRLSIPLRKGKNQQQSIRDVRIAYDQSWRSNHWHAIRSAYGNSPFFEHYADDISAFYRKKKYEFLWDFNLHLLLTLADLLGLKIELQLTPEYWKEAPANVTDFRNVISPKREMPDAEFNPVRYPQVFEDRLGFLPNLSIVDLLFCTGPEASGILRRSTVSP